MNCKSDDNKDQSKVRGGLVQVCPREWNDMIGGPTRGVMQEGGYENGNDLQQRVSPTFGRLWVLASTVKEVGMDGAGGVGMSW